MGPDATLFVVDGDEKWRAALERLGSSLALKVQTHDSGNEFLNAYRDDRVGCLVSEFRVWDTSGLQIQHRLKELGSVMPVIFVSAHGSVSLAVRALHAGAIEVIEKPADQTVLAEAIQQGVQLCSYRLSQLAERSQLERQLRLLTRRENEVFEELKASSNPQRVAERLGVSRRTVQLCRQRIAHKLGLCSAEDVNQVCQSERRHDEACRWMSAAPGSGCEASLFGAITESARHGVRSAS